MAYSRRSRSTRRSSPRSSYRSRPRARASGVRGRRTTRTARRSSGGGRTVRIEIVTANPSEASRPANLMMKPAAAPKKAAF